MPEPVTWTVSAAEALKRLEGRLFATTTETAAILDHDPRTVRKAIDAGEIPSVKVGATRRVPVAWIAEQARVGGPAPATSRSKAARKATQRSRRRPRKVAGDAHAYDSGLEQRKTKRADRLTRIRRSDDAA